MTTPQPILPQIWRPERGSLPQPWHAPSLGEVFRRGIATRCPSCGRAPLFAGFLRVRQTCSCCGAPLGTFRADDAPPYFTVLLVGHLVIPTLLLTDRLFTPALWLEMAIFLPGTLLLTLGLLRPVKGVTVGLLMRLGLGGPEQNG